MKTQDGLTLVIGHKPEAENDFVVLSRRDDSETTRTYLQPDEAVDLALELLSCARIARKSNKRYLEGKK